MAQTWISNPLLPTQQKGSASAGPFFALTSHLKTFSSSTMQYFILKTEPETYSFDDLVRDKKTAWDGVRNFQARNNLKSMNEGDAVMIYHSVGPKEIVGTAKVVKTAYPDKTADDPRWVCVDIQPAHRLKTPVTLSQLKEHPSLKAISLVRQGRLSVCPIGQAEWEEILELAGGFSK